MSVVASTSASETPAVAVSVSFVFGLAGASETVAAGALFAIVTCAEASGAPSIVPSPARTESEIWSPWSPFAAALRSSVAEVAPAIAEPFFSHW